MSGYVLGQVVELTLELRTPAGAPAAPASVACRVRQPDGTAVDLAPSGAGAGGWVASFKPTQPGDHRFRWTSVQPDSAAEGRFHVMRSEL